MKLRDKLKSSLIIRALQTIDHKDRVKLFWIALIQTSLGVLDLLGVTFIGALGALSIQGIESKKAGNHVSVLLRILHVENLSFQMQVIWLGIAAAVSMVSKTLLSIFFTRKTFRFMSNRGAKMTGDILSKVLSQNILEVQSRTSQQTLFTLTVGVRSLLVGILATTVNLLSDFSMLIILSLGLYIIDPITAFATMVFFALVGWVLHSFMQIKAQQVGEEIAKRTIINDSKILEVLRTYRESVVRNRRAFYAKAISNIQIELGSYQAEMNFFPYISKYVMDSATVLVSLILGAIVMSLNSAVHGVATLTVFLAASTRIAPAALRIQQGLIVIRTSQGSAILTIDLVNELTSIVPDTLYDDTHILNYPEFIPDISLAEVCFEYPHSKDFAVKNLNLTIEAGQSVAFVGSSGAGKSTLADLILGILQPNSGAIYISSKSPVEAVKKWPGAIAYVPQDVAIISGTIRENIALGYSSEMATDERIWNALTAAQLDFVVKEMKNGLDTDVGENGSLISGGQRQRLGIARALFTKPKLLVLDESTSALDGQTEANLTSALQVLHGDVTVLVVAHRLSTIRNVDLVVYLEKGEVSAAGSFEEVRKAVPNFDLQAQLMGL